MRSSMHPYCLFTMIVVFVFTAMIQTGCNSNASSDPIETGGDQTLLPHQPIAVWAYPDSNTVQGTASIGVVAYHSRGVQRVDMRVDNGQATSITEETVNPDTGEYEFVLTLDTTTLPDGQHTIQATAVPEESGTNTELTEITLFVANSVAFDTWYVDCRE
jgi:hypothetical protein